MQSEFKKSQLEYFASLGMEVPGSDIPVVQQKPVRKHIPNKRVGVAGSVVIAKEPVAKQGSLISSAVITSQELNSLSVHARWLYVLMVAKCPGLCQEFALSYKQMREIAGYRDERISSCLVELSDSGFIEVIPHGVGQGSSYKIMH